MGTVYARRRHPPWPYRRAESAFSRPNLVEGKPDLSSVLWRIRLDGSPPVRTSVSILLHYPHWQHGAGPRQIQGALVVRFDVHPDRRRVVFDAFELNEADIGLLENP